ncbi:MAG: TIGR03032 family protein [Pirellulales bacterium]|nr:TIGR03032 family protein [Pirellulales bacterium]
MDPVQIDCCVSDAFQAWLAQAGGSLAVSTYQAGKVALLGWDGRQVTMLLREFPKPMGLAMHEHRMVLATRHGITIFADAPLLAPEYLEDRSGRYDALYLPRVTYHTGDLHTHDVVIAPRGVILTATRFSCLAYLSSDFNFTPLWKPRFISDLVPEDRCHLNGLALRDGRPRYVTALGTTDVQGGWRENKADGGVVIDVESNEVLAEGLSMPHSPRWHADRLWVLNSGTGELLALDPQTGRRDVVCGLPGYLRGLCFVGRYAVIGLCKIREKHIFGGLPIQTRHEKLNCGLVVIDLTTGRVEGHLEFTAGCEELYDVQFLPGIYRPMIVNLEKPQARQAMTNPESSFWLRPANEIHEPPASAPAESVLPEADVGCPSA